MEESTNADRYVVDASYILAYLLPDERIDEVESVFNQYGKGQVKIYASSLLTFEVLNGLRSAILRKRISLKVAMQLIEKLLQLHILTETVSYPELFLLAEQDKLSVYDASYVWLAQTKKIPLLTLDKKLEKLSKL